MLIIHTGDGHARAMQGVRLGNNTRISIGSAFAAALAKRPTLKAGYDMLMLI